jgi:hypothetical protein
MLEGMTGAVCALTLAHVERTRNARHRTAEWLGTLYPLPDRRLLR